MKKKFLSITLAIIMCFSLGLIFVKNQPSMKTTDYEGFVSNVYEACKYDNLEVKTISSDASFEEIKQIIPETTEEDKELFLDNKEQFFSSFGFSMSENDENISIYSKFQFS